jgi:hypothetical protein
VNVRYENFPPSQIVANELPQKLSLSILTSGYHLIALKSGEEKDTLRVDVLSLTGIETGTKSVSTEMLIQSFIEQLGNDVEISSVTPDSIMFDMSPSLNMKLPVKANLDMTFEKQYDTVSLVKIIPDSVMVSIPQSQIGNISWIETEKITARDVRASIKRNVKLIAPYGSTLSLSEVELNLEVEKFTEGNLEVPVSLINIPASLKVKIFPDRVVIKYLVALSKYDDVKPDMFSVIADASDAASVTEKLEVKVISSPDFVRSVSWQPEKVEFILKR